MGFFNPFSPLSSLFGGGGGGGGFVGRAIENLISRPEVRQGISPIGETAPKAKSSAELEEEDRQKRAKRGRGVFDTIHTSSLGITTPANTAANTLLGVR